MTAIESGVFAKLQKLERISVDCSYVAHVLRGKLPGVEVILEDKESRRSRPMRVRGLYW